MILVFDNQKDLKISKVKVRPLVQEILSFLKVPYEQVAVYFVTKKAISELHDQFFQDPTPTDCISFPMDQNDLGEIFVCPKVAIEYGMKNQIDPYEETALYIIHGILHLIGYDDLEEKKRKVMRKMEKQCMDHIKKLSITLV